MTSLMASQVAVVVKNPSANAGDIRDGICDVIQLSHPLSFPSPPAFTFPNTRVFPNEFGSDGQSIGASASV